MKCALWQSLLTDLAHWYQQMCNVNLMYKWHPWVTARPTSGCYFVWLIFFYFLCLVCYLPMLAAAEITCVVIDYWTSMVKCYHGRNWSTQRKTCPIVTLSTTNPTWICLELNHVLHNGGQQPTTWAMVWPSG